MWKTLYLYRVRGSAVHAKSNSVVHTNTISPIHVENSRHTRGTDLSHTREKTLSHTRGKTCVVTACWMTTCQQRRAVEDFPLHSETYLMLLYASFHRICAHTAAMVGVKAGPVFAMYFSSRQAKPLHPCPWQANRGPLGATTYQDYKA